MHPLARMVREIVRQLVLPGELEVVIVHERDQGLVEVEVCWSDAVRALHPFCATPST